MDCDGTGAWNVTQKYDEDGRRDGKETFESFDVYKITGPWMLAAHALGEDIDTAMLEERARAEAEAEALRFGGDGHHEREHEEEDHELFQDKDGWLKSEGMRIRNKMNVLRSAMKSGLGDEERELVVVRGETVHSDYGPRWTTPMMLIGGALTVCGAVMMRRCRETPYAPISDGSAKGSKTMYV